jgi:hypothetical protein
MTLVNRVARLEAEQRNTGFCRLCYLLARTTEDEATARAGAEHARHTLEELVNRAMQLDCTSITAPEGGAYEHR